MPQVLVITDAAKFEGRLGSERFGLAFVGRTAEVRGRRSRLGRQERCRSRKSAQRLTVLEPNWAWTAPGSMSSSAVAPAECSAR